MKPILAQQPESSRPSRLYYVGKRLVDVAGASLAMLLLGPIMLICAGWIKLVDGGPVLYCQWRVGYDGWLFRIYKFRTMRQDAEPGGQAKFAQQGDPRVLPGCQWMRMSHVDELPQLFNILRGDMSLVGPRPERPEIIKALRNDLPDIDRRLAAAPGLTGLAQIRHGYTNDLAGMKTKLAYDLTYLQQRSLVGDVRIVVKTIPKFWDRAAC